MFRNMQIDRTYGSIGCYGLPHPGHFVDSPGFDGDMSKIDAGFIKLLQYYADNVIFSNLVRRDTAGQ